MIRLPGERQRDEAEHVHHPDEQHQARDVREPPPDRLGRQALLRDLRLRHLVERLADRLAARRQQREPRAHQHDAEQDRQCRADPEIDDGLRDREVERPDVDRDPFVQRDLVGRVEGASGERRRRECEREQGDGEEPLSHRAAPEKYVARERPSSKV